MEVINGCILYLLTRLLYKHFFYFSINIPIPKSIEHCPRGIEKHTAPDRRGRSVGVANGRAGSESLLTVGER
jgi:hypothetical protein